MEHLIHRAPSVGSLIKSITLINPLLNVSEIIQIIKLSTEVQSQPTGEFSQAETINESKALALAQSTVRPSHQ